MTAKLKISNELSLPLDFVTSTQAILAKKRVGKSYTAQVEAEELLKHKQQIIVIDPTGAWWGLRSSADGKSAGFPVTIFGGEHGDAPLEPDSGKMIAEAIVKDGFSAVIDLQLMDDMDWPAFIADFLRTLYRLNRDPVHLFIDEADVAAPQVPRTKEHDRCLRAASLLVRLGGIKGIGVTLISQRAALISKDVLASVDQVIALQMNYPLDIKQIVDWAKHYVDVDDMKEMIESLPSLRRGQAWVWRPAADVPVFKRINVRKKHTFDSGRTPDAGTRIREPKVLAKVDLERMAKSIADTVRRAKENDPVALKQRVAELERQVAAKSVAKPVAQPARTKVETVIKEVPVLDAKLVKELKSSVGAAQLAVEKRREDLERVSGQLGNVLRVLHAATANVAPRAPSPAPRPVPPPRATVHQHAPERTRTQQYVDAAPGAGHPTPVQQRILDTALMLADLGIAPDRAVLAAWVGSHPRSKSFQNNVGALRSAGHVAADYSLTDAGRELAHRQNISIEAVMNPLKPVQRKLLEVVLNDQKVERDDLAMQMGVHPRSKVFQNNVGALRGRGLLTDAWPIEPTRVFEAL